jgi:AcrR family transcriptional regulator
MDGGRMTRQADDHHSPDAHPPRRRNAAATRARLLDSARELFLQHGYRATGLREVAAKAGVDVTLVRRYFGSKQNLFTEATDVSGDIQAIQHAPDEAVGQHLISRVLQAHRDVDAPLFALLRSSGDPAVVARLDEQLEDGITRTLTDRITADHPRLRADMVTALLVGIGVLRALLHKEPLATANDSDITVVFTEAFHSLTKLPQGTTQSTTSPDDEHGDRRQ